MKTNKRKRGLAARITLIVIGVMLTIFTASLVYMLSSGLSESRTDELLFSLAKESNENLYYADSADICRELSSYEPKLILKRSYGEYEKGWYPSDEISDLLKNAYISVEDRDFYTHHGVDIMRTLYAAVNSVFKTRDRFGASTITQQVIKNISGDNEITVKRKLSEIMRAIRLEGSHGKDEILEVYMNIVPLGEGCVGVGSASEHYFGKSPSDLTLSEAATLVAITNAPTRFNPHTSPEVCLKKRNTVLYAMLDNGAIGEEEYNISVSEPLSVLPISDSKNGNIDSWFIETVNADVISALAEKLSITESAAGTLFRAGGYSVYTTESTLVQGILEEYFADVSHFPAQTSMGLDYSMVITDTEGKLLGIVGGVGGKRANRVLNLATVPHTPGSALKPLALYAPLIDEKLINAATVFDDVPTEFLKSDDGYIAYPKNYPDIYAGLTTVSDALRLSKNTVAARLYGIMGAERIYTKLTKDFGLSTIVRRGIGSDGKGITDLAISPLALGQLSYGVSLRELTEAYTAFPAEGILTEGRSFIALYDSTGKLVIDNSPKGREVLRRESARIMNTLLSEVTERGTASSVTLKTRIDTAGKTGTSGNDRDRLFIGYTPYLTAGIWCGYRNGTDPISSVYPTHLSIWDNVMTEIHSRLLRGIPDEQIRSFSTDGLLKLGYCKDSGALYTPDCALDPRGDRCGSSYFEPGNIPGGVCKTHVVCYYDTQTEAIATNKCPKENLRKIALVRVENRSFPNEITVTDAEYVYRRVAPGSPLPEDYLVPYFFLTLDEGEFVGRGRRKKQYNSVCYLHDDD